MARARGRTNRDISTFLDKPKNFKKTLFKLIGLLFERKIVAAVIVLCAVLSTVFAIVGPKILSSIITELFNGLVAKFTGSGGIDFDKIGIISLSLLGLYLFSMAMSIFQSQLIIKIIHTVCYKLRQDISKKIDKLPMSYFESNAVGDILSRIVNDVDTLGNGMTQALAQIITTVFTILGVIVMMLTISPLMTLISVLILPLSALLMGLAMKFSKKHFKMQQESLGNANGITEETIKGHEIVKLFNKEEKTTEEFTSENEKLYKSFWKSQFISGLMFPIMQFIGNLGYVAVAVIGGFFAFNGTIQVGDIQAFVQYVRQLSMPLSQLAQIMNQLQSMTAAAERVFEILDEKEEKDPVNVESELEDDVFEKAEAKGEVIFDKVKFGYKKNKIIIKNFSLKVNPGETVAIVGPTGAGKTTIVKLLMHFYDLNSGKIFLDGVETSKIPRYDLRKKFAMVLQDAWLFKGTIMENLKYAHMNATDEEVYDACKSAGIHHLIKAFPKGYNLEINEESDNFSQGQKQLLTIARAILADRPILILDEATSSVDTRTEIKIQSAMKELMKGRTSFVIAHRLSTIKNADNILVLNDGDIVEQGTHNALLKKKGFYADLYNSQFEK